MFEANRPRSHPESRRPAQEFAEAGDASFEAYSVFGGGAGKARRLTASRRKAVETPKYR